MARLALSTSCGAPDRPLAAVIASFAPLGIDALALHRHPAGPLPLRLRVVAVFGDGTGSLGGAPLLVVEGGPADPEDRERSLEDLCRRLHGLKAPAVALRTPSGAQHPSPEDWELIHEALPKVGYWHDVARGGEEYLEVAEPVGASFDPLDVPDLVALRGVLGAAAPAVIDLPPGSGRDRIVESIACARGVFRA